MVVVGSNEEQALAGRRIRVHRDHWDAGRDGAIDVILHERRIRHRHQDSGGFALHGLLERLLLRLGVVGVRTREFGTHFELHRSLEQSCPAGLPVWNLDIGGNQVVLLIGIVTGSAADQKNQQNTHDDFCRYGEVAHRTLLANRHDPRPIGRETVRILNPRAAKRKELNGESKNGMEDGRPARSTANTGEDARAPFTRPPETAWCGSQRSWTDLRNGPAATTSIPCTNIRARTRPEKAR